MNILNKLKKSFWVAIKPIFPYIRDILVKLRVIKHPGRQKFLIGKLAPHRNPDELYKHLENQGFEHHTIAWVDEGEVFGMRYLENFHFQYHVRLFTNGEIRGHYEYSVESKPIAHFLEQDIEPRREVFLGYLEGFLELENTDSQSAPATSLGSPNNG